MNVTEDGQYSIDMNIRAVTVDYDKVDRLTVCVVNHGHSNSRLILTALPFINKVELTEVECDIYYIILESFGSPFTMRMKQPYSKIY